MKLKHILFAIWLLAAITPLTLVAQSRTVTGKITGKDGEPIPNATISVANAGNAVADEGGNFRISAPLNTSLQVSATGYKTQTIAVNQDNFQIQLSEDVARLDEVIVTGLATSVKRRNLPNAIVTISASQLSAIAPAQTFDAALEGKIAGAYINSNNGAPGGGSSIKLRGVTSIYGNTQPLYVLDGVIVNNAAVSGGLNTVTLAVSGYTSNQDNASNRIADLRPEDIENIEILKGASASAIYGSKAAAGVIIITTKRGHQGKTSINFSQDIGFVKARKLLGVRQFTAESAASLSRDSAAGAALAQQFLDAKAAGKIYDYEKELYGETGFTRNSIIRLTGGTDKTNFYFSAANRDEDGIIKNTGYGNKSLRLNLDHNINDDVKINISTNYINSSADRGLTGNDNAG
ncbi:MAG TPA: TonB-dependent receptor plug domain-containing protein, partial [Flavitalea sp.]|nr:TonB-dependent receptor plug domain-containing protein [Flavitalea sp.]